MTTTVIELYDALIEAGASEDKSRRAAQAVTDFDGQLGSVERRIDGVVARIDRLELSVQADIASFRAEVRAEFLEFRSEMRGDILSLRGDNLSLRAELKGDIAGVKTEAGIMKVMLGLIVTLSIAVFLKLFLH